MDAEKATSSCVNVNLHNYRNERRRGNRSRHRSLFLRRVECIFISSTWPVYSFSPFSYTQRSFFRAPQRYETKFPRRSFNRFRKTVDKRLSNLWRISKSPKNASGCIGRNEKCLQVNNDGSAWQEETRQPRAETSDVVRKLIATYGQDPCLCQQGYVAFSGVTSKRADNPHTPSFLPNKVTSVTSVTRKYRFFYFAGL